MAICLHKLCGVSYNTFDTFGDEGELNSDGVIWTTMGGEGREITSLSIQTHLIPHKKSFRFRHIRGWVYSNSLTRGKIVRNCIPPLYVYVWRGEIWKVETWDTSSEQYVILTNICNNKYVSLAFNVKRGVVTRNTC